jgi:hypothetical protein
VSAFTSAPKPDAVSKDPDFQKVARDSPSVALEMLRRREEFERYLTIVFDQSITTLEKLKSASEAVHQHH